MSKKYWRQQVRKVAEDLLPELGDIWAADDPYDLVEASEVAFAANQSPEDFIQEMFAEDLASRAYDDHLRKESLRYEDEE